MVVVLKQGQCAHLSHNQDTEWIMHSLIPSLTLDQVNTVRAKIASSRVLGNITWNADLFYSYK